MEEDIDSRYVVRDGDKWDVQHGPLSFDNMPENNWSFLVQSVNYWHEGAACLVTPFRQLPGWLLDDLMISYSTPGGGVVHILINMMYLLLKVQANVVGV